MSAATLPDLKSPDETRYRDLFWHSVYPAFQTSLDEKFILVNPAFATMLGYENPDELLKTIEGGEASTFVDPEARRRCRQLLSESNQIVNEGEFLMKRKNGEEFWALVHSRAVKSSSGEMLYYEGSVLDISREKRYEDQFRMINTSLKEQSIRLRNAVFELQQLSDLLANDLYTPLRMVHSYLNLIQKKCSSRFDEETQELLGYATQGSTQMKHLLSSLIDYSRIRVLGKPTKCALVRTAVNMAIQNLCFEIAETKAEIRIGDLPEVYIEEKFLILVFQNLIGNSIKYRGLTPPQIEILCAQTGGSFRFSIADNGRGIFEEDRERVFLPYHRGKEVTSIPGAGLGLAICKKIILGYGGEIWLESETGKGTTVCFKVPKNPSSFQ